MNDITWKSDILERWSRFIYPARPDPAERNAYLQSIEYTGKEHPNILILGATPEIRDDFLHKLLDVTCCDYSRKHFEALKELCQNKTQEKFIESDWTHIPEDRTFDIIVGDHVVNMMKTHDQPKFFSKLSALTNPGGIVGLRTILRLSEKRFTEPALIAQHYKKNNSHYNFYTATHYEFLQCAYNDELDYVKVADAYKLVEDAADYGLISDEDREQWEIRGKNITLEIYLPDMETLTNLFVSHSFTVEKQWWGDQPYSPFVPITFARKVS